MVHPLYRHPRCLRRPGWPPDDDIPRGELDEVEEIMRRSRFDGRMQANQSLELMEAVPVATDEALTQSHRARGIRSG
ncbi:hypothetical protein [Synechococcus sp. GFB01]|uniref:hypothetical protein n=1 Tax=Synechococcus sp. GFB01 TaxID=1662190 RepID=UPI000A4FCCA6|nr:hypothetical protein [Synechococcus sp. GFB01]